MCGSGHTVVWFLYRYAIRILLDVERQRVVRDGGEKKKMREREKTEMRLFQKLCNIDAREREGIGWGIKTRGRNTFKIKRKPEID